MQALIAKLTAERGPDDVSLVRPKLLLGRLGLWTWLRSGIIAGPYTLEDMHGVLSQRSYQDYAIFYDTRDFVLVRGMVKLKDSVREGVVSAQAVAERHCFEDAPLCIEATIQYADLLLLENSPRAANEYLRRAASVIRAAPGLQPPWKTALDVPVRIQYPPQRFELDAYLRPDAQYEAHVVTLRMTITDRGLVQSVQVVDAGGVSAAAAGAIRGAYRATLFRPAVVDGAPVTTKEYLHRHRVLLPRD